MSREAEVVVISSKVSRGLRDRLDQYIEGDSSECSDRSQAIRWAVALLILSQKPVDAKALEQASSASVERSLFVDDKN